MTKYDIYFHAKKYKKVINNDASIVELMGTNGCHHKQTSAIFINVNRLIHKHNKHGVLHALPDFDARFNLVVSHEVLHKILTKYICDDASTRLDDLTVKYWIKNIDINTNYDVEY